MAVTPRQEEIAEYLRGTCNSSQDAAQEFDCDDDEVLEAVVATELEWCAVCGWVCDVNEMDDLTGDMVCPDCVDVDTE